jgi:hypothetical protein
VQAHTFMDHLRARLSEPVHGGAHVESYYSENSTPITIQTEASSKSACWDSRRDRVYLVVSSTSWTPDEDFRVCFPVLRACQWQCTRSQHQLHYMMGCHRQMT